MELRGIVKQAGALLAAAAIGSGVTYFACSSGYDNKIAELKEQIATLEKEGKEAIVTKRISEQMEEIALQQSTISEREKERAEKQSRIADLERMKAELNQRQARQAEAEALASKEKADLMLDMTEGQREIALMNMQQAEEAKSKADTLMYLSLGKSLAQSALQLSSATSADSSVSELPALLSYASWKITKEYGGDISQQEVFEALVKNSGADKLVLDNLKGNVTDIALPQDGGVSAFYTAVTDYGEVVIIPRALANGWNDGLALPPTILFSNSRYDFRNAIMPSDNTCTVLDIDGNMFTFIDNGDIKSTLSATLLPKDKYSNLMLLDDGSYAIAGKHHIVWISGDLQSITRTENIEKEIVSASLMNGKPTYICSDGTLYAASGETIDGTGIPPLGRGEIPATYMFDKTGNTLFLSLENGNIGQFSRNGYASTLYGHSSGVTQMITDGVVLISASYDGEVRLWNTDKRINNSVAMKYGAWPLSLAYDSAAKMLYIGLEGGAIRQLSVSPDNNAIEARKHVSRGFTLEEWNNLVGPQVPYRSFNDD